MSSLEKGVNMRARDFRERARDSLAGKWFGAVLVTLLADILGGSITMDNGAPVGNILTNAINGSNQAMNNGSSSWSVSGPQVPSFVPGIILSIVGTLIAVYLIYAIIMYIVGGVISLGLSRYNLRLLDGENPGVEDLFHFFHQNMFGKAFWLKLRETIFIFLWSLLLLIPGIVKAYSYSMAGFILSENPEMTPKQAMEVSMTMMDGNKWRLFCLDLSFIGWGLLCVLTLGIGLLWLIPYKNAAIASFYDEVSRQPIA